MSTRIFRMVHINNIPHILQNGITHVNSPYANPNFVSIGSGSLISRRNTFTCPNGNLLGAYIPFYFGVQSPMLYMIQNGYGNVAACPPQNIVYIVSNIQSINNLGLNFIFTDGHAVSGLTNFYDDTDVSNINTLLDFNAIGNNDWGGEENRDLKRKKEAEFLVDGDIPTSAITGFVVYNQAAEQILLRFGVTQPIAIRTNFYF